MNDKIANILRGAFIIVMGVLVAVCGIGTALDTYFGVVFIVAGVLLAGIGLYGAIKKLPVMTTGFLLGGVLITLAIALFMQKLTFAVLIGIAIFALMGFGFGLVALGIATIAHRNLIYGLGEAVLGGLFILFTALYLGIPDFQQAFWIIVGILMIVFGIAVIFLAIFDKKLKK